MTNRSTRREDDLLTGWKEIESFLGLGRLAIKRNGFPVRKNAGAIFALKKELLAHIGAMKVKAIKNERK